MTSSSRPVRSLLVACVAIAFAHLALAADLNAQQQVVFHQEQTPSNASPDELKVRLRHVWHRGGRKHPNVHRRLDIDDTTFFATGDGSGRSLPHHQEYTIRQRPVTIQRLATRPTAVTYHHDAKLATTQEAWTEELISGPDVTDRETVLSFARMASNAYIEEPGTGDWRDVGNGFNSTNDFGWEDEGLRGHVFATADNKTVVIAMKGTSLPFKDPWGTISNDKTNDNLLFSCCCGQGGRWLWHQVCSCQTESNTCNSTCLASELRDKSMYYYKAQELFFNVSQVYNGSDIWLTGHSLGGSLSSLVGLFAGRPVVTFEAPAEAMAAARLGLPTPPDTATGLNAYNRATTAGYHFGHTADDIFMGNCNAVFSLCTLAGYAMETKCHTGHECVYDTVKDNGWSPNSRYYHGIGVVLDEVLEAYDELPDCKVRTHCDDCNQWNFTKAEP